jgi:HTH-type transcriptional regulator/antitoxin HigA
MVPPGHYVREALDHYGMSQAELAERMGRPVQAVSEIINGKKEVTEETAFELESVLRTPAHVWLNLECQYRYARQSVEWHEQLSDQVEAARAYPYNELAKLGYVPRERDKTERVTNLLRFFGVARLALVETSYAAAFRKAAKHDPDPHALAAWLRIGEILAGRLDLPAYNREELRKAIPEVRRRTRTVGEIDGAIQEALRPAGVAFVTAPHLPKTYANGATFWHGGRPVILLSVRGGYSDIIWFTLFHELGHIWLHAKSATFIEGLGAKSYEEREADEFACETLIRPKDWEVFREAQDFSVPAVKQFADEQEICASIVVGRLMHEHRAFDGFHHLRHLRRKMTF